MEFHGVKVALLIDDKLVMHQRDNTPGLFNAGLWDFPGGGRDGNETPEECAIREIKEELEIELLPSDFVWKKDYPAQKDPTQRAFFLVALVNESQVDSIVLHEGQAWALVSEKDFFNRTDVVEALKGRFQDYLDEM